MCDSNTSLVEDRIMHFMGMALEQGKQAIENYEVPVGCVFVRGDRVIGEAFNQTNATRNATRHAELVAIDSILLKKKEFSSNIFAECDLFVTCEPCIMCASALAQLGLKRVYYGCSNERFGGCGSILSIHEGKFNCVSGIREKEAVELFQSFYKRGNPLAPDAKRARSLVLN